jgi:surfeit locus 1 family protein
MTLEVSKTFRPSIAGTVALFLLTTLFTNLGLWQTKRAAEKSDTEQQHQAATTVAFEVALKEKKRFARIDVTGHYDQTRHILLDNQILNGRAGVHVYTPFYTAVGAVILVNRGWLPLAADRQSLPEIETPQQETELAGMLNIVPVPGRLLGQADRMTDDQWPQLVTYLNLEDIAESLDAPLEDWVIQLSDADQTGFEGRDWKPVFLSSSRHKAYAFQWFALSTASIVLWLLSGFRKPSENST